jgi:glycosyltransferase involved in cell wall biosynthesis
MRVLQLIDSLHPGGAERMAVTLANELAERIDASFLCASREEGLLKNAVYSKVEYLFLNKKKTIDFTAIRRLNAFVIANKINVIHAHSSSFFYGWLMKLMNPSIRLIWHDHYGNSEQLEKRNAKMLRFCSARFSGIIAVNTMLANWNKKRLRCDTVYFVKNFVSKNRASTTETTTLSGKVGKRILCIANLRPQKDHQNLLAAFLLIKKAHPDVSLHLVGKGDSNYGADIIQQIKENANNSVYYYGALTLTTSIYEQSNLGVLSSLSEGLPVSLLEYGLNGLPVVTTDVGECKEVILSYGKVVSPDNSEKLANACIYYLDHYEEAKEDADNFKKHIQTNYSFNSIFEELLQLYQV